MAYNQCNAKSAACKGLAAKRRIKQNSLLRIPDSFKRIIVTEGSMPAWYTEEGTEVVSVEKWLLGEE